LNFEVRFERISPSAFDILYSIFCDSKESAEKSPLYRKSRMALNPSGYSGIITVIPLAMPLPWVTLQMEIFSFTVTTSIAPAFSML